MQRIRHTNQKENSGEDGEPYNRFDGFIHGVLATPKRELEPHR
jgi:hypothetical protein